MIFSLVFLVLMFFAWAIGGEEGFGKWKRGMLVLIPMTLLGLFKLPWYLLILQVPLMWAVYQALSYDDGINLFYNDIGWKKWLGASEITINGGICYLTSLAFILDCGEAFRFVLAGLVCVATFWLAVALSNDKRFSDYRLWLLTNAPSYKYLNFKDSWYVSEGIIGMGIGLSCLILAK